MPVSIAFCLYALYGYIRVSIDLGKNGFKQNADVTGGAGVQSKLFSSFFFLPIYGGKLT